MAFGFNVLTADGTLSYSSTDVTWNQVDFFSVDGNGYVSKDYPILVNQTVLVIQMFINPPPTDRKAIAHTIVAKGANVTVQGGSESAYILVLMK